MLQKTDMYLVATSLSTARKLRQSTVQSTGYKYTVRLLKNKIHIEEVCFWFCPRVNFIWMFAHSTGPAAAHLSSSSTCVHQSSAVCGRNRHQLHHQHHVSISPNVLFYTHGSQHMFASSNCFNVSHLDVPVPFLTLRHLCTPRPQLPSIMRVSRPQAHRPPHLAHLWLSRWPLEQQVVCPCLWPSLPARQQEGPQWWLHVAPPMGQGKGQAPMVAQRGAMWSKGVTC